MKSVSQASWWLWEFLCGNNESEHSQFNTNFALSPTVRCDTNMGFNEAAQIVIMIIHLCKYTHCPHYNQLTNFIHALASLSCISVTSWDNSSLCVYVNAFMCIICIWCPRYELSEDLGSFRAGSRLRRWKPHLKTPLLTSRQRGVVVQSIYPTLNVVFPQNRNSVFCLFCVSRRGLCHRGARRPECLSRCPGRLYKDQM